MLLEATQNNSFHNRGSKKDLFETAAGYKRNNMGFELLFYGRQTSYRVVRSDKQPVNYNVSLKFLKRGDG